MAKTLGYRKHKNVGDLRVWMASQIRDGISAKVKAITGSLMLWAQKHYKSHLFSDPSIFHKWITETFQDFHKKRGQKICVIAPRGNAKSTWLSLIYVSLCALEGWEPYIILTSDSATQARLLLEALKEVIEHSPEIRKAYQFTAGKGPVWREDRIKLKNGVLIEAFGTKGKIRGRRKNKDRPSLIVVDDPQNDENIESADQRKKDQNWLDKAVIPAGNKRTNIVLIGTALHRHSLVMNASRNAGWKSKLFKSVIQWPDNMKLWNQWQDIYCDQSNPDREEQAQAFYFLNRRAMDKGAKVLWSQEESLYELMVLRVLIGKVSFESEKQNNPRKPDTVEFPSDYFGDWLRVPLAEWPGRWDYQIKVTSVDPSKGKNAKKGDYSAIIDLGRKDKLLYAKGDLKRRPVSRIIEDTVAHCIDFQPDALAIESNAFQELIGDDIIKELAAENLEHIEIHLIENHVNKTVRIRRLGGGLHSREYRFLEGHEGTDLLVEQLEDFPTGAHDDGPDALEMARRVMIDVFNSRMTDPL